MIISQFARTFCQFVSSRLSARASTCLPAMIAATLMLQCCIREQSRAHRPFCSPKLSKLTFQLKIVWKVSAAKWSETLRSTFFQKFLPETALLSLFLPITFGVISSWEQLEYLLCGKKLWNSSDFAAVCLEAAFKRAALCLRCKCYGITFQKFQFATWYPAFCIRREILRELIDCCVKLTAACQNIKCAATQVFICS